MKSFSFTIALALLFSTISYAQVEIDRPVELTGPDGSRAVKNLELPVNDSDAANKEYVDGAISTALQNVGTNITFTVNASVSSVTVPAGANNSSSPVVISVAHTSGDILPVLFSVTGLPANVTAVFSPIAGFASFSSDLVFNVGLAATPGTYPLVVRAHSGSYSQAVNVTLVISNYKIVFVTANAYNGNIGGRSGADAKCQQEATNAGQTGTFIAYISTGSGDARDYITDAEYRTVDGLLVASSKADLLDGSLTNPINKTITGTTSNAQVWTGTNESGVKRSATPNYGTSSTASAGYCTNWTGSINAMWAIRGDSSATDGTWVNISGDDNCDGSKRLYCFQQ